MRILAVDTSTAACSSALWLEGEGREVLELTGSRHSDVLLPMIESLLAEANCGLQRLDAIAFGEGPGSFTGLRIGIGVVQALAFGADLPVIPVSSLHAQALRSPGPRVLAAFDARMHQIYWCTYRRLGPGWVEPEAPPSLAGPAQVELRAGHRWLAVGTGCDRYRAALESANPQAEITFVAHSFPHALDVARLAAGLGVDAAVPAERALPRYLRDEVAQRKKKVPGAL